MADQDVEDTYTFALTATQTGGVEVRFAKRAVFTVSAAALERAPGWFRITQLAADDADDVRVPPFLLPRETLRSLKSEGSARWKTLWSENTTELSWVGTQAFDVTVGGKKKRLSALRLKGDELNLVVLDDEAWPFVLSLTEYDNHWRLEDAAPVGAVAQRKAAPASKAKAGAPSPQKVAAKVKAARGSEREAVIARFASEYPLDELFDLLNEKEHALKDLARAALRALAGEKAFRGALLTRFARAFDETRKAKTPYRESHTGDLQPEAVEQWHRLFSVTPKDFEAVAPLVRAAAKDHPCDFVRAACMSRAIELDDMEVCRHAGPLVKHPEPQWRSIGFWAAGQLPYAEASKLLGGFVSKKSLKTEEGVEQLYEVLEAISRTDDASQWLPPAFTWRAWVTPSLLRSDRRIDGALAHLVEAALESPPKLDAALLSLLGDAFCASTSDDLNTNLSQLFASTVKDPVGAGLLRCLGSSQGGFPAFLEKPLATVSHAKLTALPKIIDGSRVAADDIAAIIVRRKDASTFKTTALALLEQGLVDEALTKKLQKLSRARK